VTLRSQGMKGEKREGKKALAGGEAVLRWLYYEQKKTQGKGNAVVGEMTKVKGGGKAEGRMDAYSKH